MKALIRSLKTVIVLLGGSAFSFYLWYMVQENDPNRVSKGKWALVGMCVVLLLFSISEFRFKHKVLKYWLQSFERTIKYDIVSREYQSRISVFRLKLGLFLQFKYLWAGLYNLGHLLREKKIRPYLKNWPHLFRQYYCIWDRVITQREYKSLTYLSATRNGEQENGIVDFCYKNDKEVVVDVPLLEVADLPSTYPDDGVLKKQIKDYLNATHLTEDSYSHLLTMSQLSTHFIAVPLRKPNQETWGVLLLEIKEQTIPKEVRTHALDKMILAAQLFQSLQNSLT